MATKRGAIAKYLLKWLVIPVGLAAIGFFVVGPRLGRHVPPPNLTRIAPPPPEEEPEPERKFKSEPEVEVTSRPATRQNSRRRRNRSSRSSSSEARLLLPQASRGAV